MELRLVIRITAGWGGGRKLTLREETAQRCLPLPAWDWKGGPGSLPESEGPTPDSLPSLNLSYHLKSLGQTPTFTPRATSSPHPAYPSTQACDVAHSQGPEHSATPLPGLRVTWPPCIGPFLTSRLSGKPKLLHQHPVFATS